MKFYKLLIPVLIVAILYLSACSSCYDGRGDFSYYSNNAVNLTEKDLMNMWITTAPDKITEARVGYIYSECGVNESYNVRKGGKMKRIRAEEFHSYIREYNESCDGCLSMYPSGSQPIID